MGNHMIKRDNINDTEFEIISQDQMMNLTYLISNITQKQYILRKTYKNKLTELQLKQLKIEHPNVTQLVEYRFDKDNIHLYLLFEAPFLTLEALRVERQQMRRNFTQMELLSIFGQVIQGLLQIRKNWGFHQALKSSNLLVDSQSNIRVTYPLTKTLLNNFSRAKISPTHYPKQIYLSPYQYNCLKNNIETKIGHEKESDIFTLGMIILQLGLLKTLQFVYSSIEGVKQNIIKNCLNDFQSRYSSGFTDILKKILIPDPFYQISLEQIDNSLKSFNQYKRQYSSSTNSDIYPSKTREQNIQFFDNIIVFQESIQSSQVTTPRLNTFYQQTRQKSQTSEKRLSPNYAKKKLLMQQSNHLSSSIKNKLDNLLKASHKLKTFQYTSTSQQKSRSKNFDTFSINSLNHRRNSSDNISVRFNNKINQLQQIKLLNSKQLTKLSQIHNNQKLIESRQMEVIFDSAEERRNYLLNGERQNNRVITQQSNLFSFAPNKDRTPTQQSMFEVVPNINLSELSSQQNNQMQVPLIQFPYFQKLRIETSSTRLAQTDRISSQTQSRYETFESQPFHNYSPRNQCNNGITQKLMQILSHSPSLTRKKSFANFRQSRQVSENKKLINYQGEVKNGLKHGKGKYTFSDGAVYNGQWSLNKMHGNGELYYASGKLAYSGQWFRDKMQGFGKLFNDNPTIKKINHKNFLSCQNSWFKYEGTFKNDNKHGNGTLFFPSGQTYCGQFHNNLIDGEGIFTSKTQKIQGKWQNGQLKIVY